MLLPSVALASLLAALAWGAGEIAATPKICGPGNAWVAEAKTYVASLPGGPRSGAIARGAS